MTDGQVDVLKRVPAGLYILEELKAPKGYVKAMPKGLAVEDGSEIQKVKMTDRPVSGYFEKLDAPESFRVRVIDKDQVLEETQFRTEGKAGFSYGWQGPDWPCTVPDGPGLKALAISFPGTVWKRRKKRLQAGRHSMNRTGNRRLQPNG